MTKMRVSIPAIDRLEKMAKGDDPVIKAVDEYAWTLPDGELKKFFQKFQKNLALINKIVEQRNRKRVDKALIILEKTGQEIPEAMRPDIAKIIRDLLTAMMTGLVIIRIR